MPNELEKKLALMGIEELSEHHGNAGCNDLRLKHSPELRQLWREWNAWNMQIPVDKVDDSDDQYVPYGPVRDGEVILFDSLQEYVLRKMTGLL